MFFTLRNHTEKQNDCGINLTPSDPFAQTLEMEKKEKISKCCCSMCSMGHICSKNLDCQEKEC